MVFLIHTLKYQLLFLYLLHCLSKCLIFLCVGYKCLDPYNIVFLFIQFLVSHNHTKTHTLYSIYNIFFFIMQMVAKFSTFSIFILLDKKAKSLQRSCKFSGYWISASSIFYIAIIVRAFIKPLLLYSGVSSTHLRQYKGNFWDI